MCCEIWGKYIITAYLLAYLFLLWEVCDIFFTSNKCRSWFRNRLKSHLMPPVSNGCKFSLFVRLQNTFQSQFLRLHVCNLFLAHYLQPQNGILSSFSSSRVEVNKQVVWISKQPKLISWSTSKQLTNKDKLQNMEKNHSTRSAFGWMLWRTKKWM